MHKTSLLLATDWVPAHHSLRATACIFATARMQNPSLCLSIDDLFALAAAFLYAAVESRCVRSKSNKLLHQDIQDNSTEASCSHHSRQSRQRSYVARASRKHINLYRPYITLYTLNFAGPTGAQSFLLERRPLAKAVSALSAQTQRLPRVGKTQADLSLQCGPCPDPAKIRNPRSPNPEPHTPTN